MFEILNLLLPWILLRTLLTRTLTYYQCTAKWSLFDKGFSSTTAERYTERVLSCMKFGRNWILYKSSGKIDSFKLQIRVRLAYLPWLRSADLPERLQILSRVSWPTGNPHNHDLPFRLPHISLPKLAWLGGSRICRKTSVLSRTATLAI